MRQQYPIKIRWNDVDTYGHVNNVAMLGLVQEARTYFLRDIAWFDHGTRAVDGAMIIVAQQTIEYRAQLPYEREPILIDVWIERLGGADIELAYEIRSGDHQQLFAVATNVIVFVDDETARPRRLLNVEREAAQPYVDEPVKFRHRR